MQAWRIEFAGPPFCDYRKYHQSSIYVRDFADAQDVFAFVRGIVTWKQWLIACEEIGKKWTRELVWGTNIQ